MKQVHIDVTSREEGAQLKRGLADPTVRALVRIMGVLSTLPSDRARERVLRVVDDKFDEEDPAYVSVFKGPPLRYRIVTRDPRLPARVERSSS
jgi:hypothetical protein